MTEEGKYWVTLDSKGDLGICVDRPTIGPDGELKMEAPREKKGKIQ